MSTRLYLSSLTGDSSPLRATVSAQPVHYRFPERDVNTGLLVPSEFLPPRQPCSRPASIPGPSAFSQRPLSKGDASLGWSTFQELLLTTRFGGTELD